MLAIIAWTAVLSGAFFFAMKKLGLLRVSLVDEIIGLDITEMGSHDVPALVMSAFHRHVFVEESLVRKATLGMKQTNSARGVKVFDENFEPITEVKP